jgi:hypothetical protein
VITIKSDDVSFELIAITIRSDNDFHKHRVITMKSDNFSPQFEALCNNAKM